MNMCLSVSSNEFFSLFTFLLIYVNSILKTMSSNRIESPVSNKLLQINAYKWKVVHSVKVH